MDINEYEAVIEALLFAYGNHLEIDKLALAINKDIKDTKNLVKGLMYKYKNENRGLQIIEVEGAYQMCTNPIYFTYIEKILKNNTKKALSQTLIETLAIIAYKQPITRSQIEEIRGVSAGHAINKLIEYNLVCEKGRLNAPGKPILFGTTNEFLKHFGFNSIESLPEMPTNNENLFKEALEEIENSI